jgi:PAS domain S-box-containing protein
LDPLAIVRQNFDAFQARDFDAVLEGVAEDWQYIPGPYVGSPGLHYQGHDGYRTMLDAGAWRDSEFEIDVEIRRVGPYVLAEGTARIEDDERELTSKPTATLHLVHDGRIQVSQGFADLEEAMAAASLTANEEFRLAFDAAPDAMALLDDQGRIVHANRVAAYLLGLPQRDLQGIPIARFAAPELQANALELWERFKRDGQASGAGAILGADGTRRLLEFRASTNYVTGRHLAIGRLRDGRRRPRMTEEGVLTPRQRDVLTMLASGLNGPEAAARLYLSPATVRTHVQNAMNALGAKTRAQAVAEALIRGEIELHPRDQTEI